jgi:3-methylfumaryl-CoA hydratase
MTMTEPAVSTDVCALGAVRRIAAMLDLEPGTFIDGAALPRGWHFFLLGGATRRSDLRADGFPGFGVPMPDLGLPRLMLAGRRVTYRSDLVIGSAIERRSVLAKVTQKTTTSGDMAFVTIQHDLTPLREAEPAIVEEQTYILLGPSKARSDAGRPTEIVKAEHTKVVSPDDTLLFQYSALGFNSHKIHIDRAYARDVEGLPDLVVNGGLAMLLLTEFLRVDLGLAPTRIVTKHTAPLYCGRPMTLAADRAPSGWRMRALDDRSAMALEAEVSVS